MEEEEDTVEYPIVNRPLMNLVLDEDIDSVYVNHEYQKKESPKSDNEESRKIKKSPKGPEVVYKTNLIKTSLTSIDNSEHMKQLVKSVPEIQTKPVLVETEKESKNKLKSSFSIETTERVVHKDIMKQPSFGKAYKHIYQIGYSLMEEVSKVAPVNYKISSSVSLAKTNNLYKDFSFQ